MNKKLVATLTIAIFLISTFAIVAPAQASFTLGNTSGFSPYEINNFDPHVAGPIGYVWPGSGQNAYDGAPNYASDNLSPGYQAPYPHGNPPVFGGAPGSGGAPSNSWYQLEGDTYAPFGAILTNSTGDLIFGLNATGLPSTWCSPYTQGGVKAPAELQECSLATVNGEQTYANSKGWGVWDILIPPEFTVPDSSQVVTTLTNQGFNVQVYKLGPDDRYAPGWTLVRINADGTIDASATNPASSTACLTGSTAPCYYNHQFINFTSNGEWYYVRINGVTAPSIAGRYFFKMMLQSGSSFFGAGPTNGPSLSQYQGFFGGGMNPSVWVPPQNWPVVLVKGEVDPAIITGTLRYAGYNSTLYQQPIAEAGQVWAHMTMRLDPYTGQQRPDLPTIDGQAYVNATANGHYELEGLAPGLYDVYAEAAGYPQVLCESGVTVLKGQSLHFDCYLQPGPVIHGNVFTKHQFGDEPWPAETDYGIGGTPSAGSGTVGQYMKIELYANATLSNIVDPSAGAPVSWSPLPCVAGGQEEYYAHADADACGDPRLGSAIAFPWHEYSTVSASAYNDQNSPTPDLFNGAKEGYSRDVAESDVCVPGNLACAFLTSDPEGVGPPQQWYVAGGTTTPFHFEFGLKGQYGAPKDLSGEVPQVYATWINGLTPGRYYVRAWTFRYVQTALDGATFQEYYFDVTPNEWAGDVTLPIDLRLSSWVNKTVYFHDTPNTITTSPVHSGAGFLWGVLQGADGHVYAANVTGLGLLENPSTSTGLLPPFNTAGAEPYYYYDASPHSNANACSAYYSDANGQAVVANSNTFATGEVGAPSQECPYGGPNNLDKGFLNANAIATGRAAIQFWGINDTWGGEDYGIPSGTYTPNVATNGYYSPTPAEQVSVTLSGNPTSISDHLFLGPGFNVSVYSIDWERPRVSRDWVWSGCQTNEGLGCLGDPIDLGWYQVVNGTAGKLYDWVSAESSALPSTVFSASGGYGDGLVQGPGGVDCINQVAPAYTCAQMDGGGRNVLPGYSVAHDAFFGSAGFEAYVGGLTSGLDGWSFATKLLQDSMFTSAPSEWPSHFAEGQYNLAGYTYGYIQDKDFTAYAQNGQVADMKVNLIIGVNVTLQILFKKESIITGTPFNMSGRVRLFNDQGQLVAEWLSSEGVYQNPAGSSFAFGADGALPKGGNAFGMNDFPAYPYSTLGGSPFTQTSSNLNGYNFVPAGTTLLHLTMAGLPSYPWYGSDAYHAGTYFGDPLFPPDFEFDAFPAAYGQYPFPNYGIPGAPDYTGGWTAEVDFVPWYAANAATQEAASGGGQSVTSGTSLYAQYYPPVNGLLMGESYHIIPGTTATSGISLTEDMALSSGFIGHSMAANHLGPYSQEGVWQIAGAHNSGEASAIFEVDLNGFISGNVLAFTWSNEFRTLSWGTISVTGASGATWPFYTYDGIYQAWLPTGSYKFSIAAPGYAAQTWSVSISPGESGSGQNVYLEQSNIPVPEFGPATAIVAFAALAASVYLLKRRRK